MSAVAAATPDVTATDDDFALFAKAVDGEARAVDISWLSRKLGKEVASATIRQKEKMGGMSGEFCFLDVTLAAEGPVAMVAKSAPAGKPSSTAVGLAREAIFYRELAPRLAESKHADVPRCFYAAGDLATGQMLVLLECLEDAVPAGVFFGPGNPNNWAFKEQLASLSQGNPSAEDATQHAFSLYARLHAAYWQDQSLLDMPWLRASDWLRGEGEASWRGAQKYSGGKWEATLAQLEALGPRAFAATEGQPQVEVNGVKWDAHLVACLKSGFGKALAVGGWESYLAEARERPMTLVHGDAHPHNALWVGQRTPAARLCLIDFEMVGCGSPAQDLGQYAISHLTPAARRQCEHELVDAYHSEVVRSLEASGKGAQAAGFTREVCWLEYVAGGAGRWAWFVPLLGTGAVAQFFHDQLAAFLHDHVPDPEAAPTPRV